MGFPYDYNSILHYPEYAGSVNDERTIVPKKSGVKIPDTWTTLSPIDVAEVKTLYRCK